MMPTRPTLGDLISCFLSQGKERTGLVRGRLGSLFPVMGGDGTGDQGDEGAVGMTPVTDFVDIWSQG